MKKHTGYSAVGVIIGIAVAVFIAIAAYIVIDGNNKATNFNDYDFTAFIPADEHTGNINDHIKSYDKELGIVTDDVENAKKAPVVIVEYADFQCGYCAMMNPYVNAVVEELEGDLAVVYRNFLLSYHQNGTAAATAAEAAGLQGYWKKYADKLFAEQTEWQYASGSERTNMFKKYFEAVTNGQGDLTKFENDLKSSSISKKISFDMGIAQRIDIGGTPSFYIDGQLIDFSNKQGSSITVNGKTFTWEGSMTTGEFKQLIKNIVYAKMGK